MRKVKKKEFSEKYDLVIGNPPYGEHRGLYKGLGEEPKISKYEDYFVKRSLDSLKPEGILAMVLPSGWLNRQSQLKNAQLIEGFRLPSGVFAGTGIGTDIIILKRIRRKFPEIFRIILKLILTKFWAKPVKRPIVLGEKKTMFTEI